MAKLNHLIKRNKIRISRYCSPKRHNFCKKMKKYSIQYKSTAFTPFNSHINKTSKRNINQAKAKNGMTLCITSKKAKLRIKYSTFYVNNTTDDNNNFTLYAF